MILPVLSHVIPGGAAVRPLIVAPVAPPIFEGVGPFPVNLWGLGGQSNALGQGTVAELSPANVEFGERIVPGLRLTRESACPSGYNSVAACATVTPWGPLAPHLGTEAGPELSLLRRLRDRFGGQHAIVKHATNGSGMEDDWDPNGIGTGIRMFDRMIAFINTRLAQLPAGSGLAGFIWIQGEDDAGHPFIAAQYAPLLTAFINALRAAFGPIGVVIAKLSPSAAFAEVATIIAAQESVAAALPGVVAVDTSDLTYRDANVHYSSDSLMVLGARLADAMPAPALLSNGGRKTIGLERLTSLGSTTDGTSYSTAIVGPKPDRLVVVMVANSELVTNPGPPSGVAGAGITFSHVHNMDYDLVSAGQNLSMWIGSTPTPVRQAITATFGTTQTSCCLSVFELGAGLDLASPIVQYASVGPLNGTTLSASLPAPPSHANNLLVAGFGANTGNLSLDPLAYPIDTVVAGSPVTRLSTEYYVGQQTALASGSVATDWGAIVAEFRAALV